jgi:hypothetical protein
VMAKTSYRSTGAVGALALIVGAALLITLDPHNGFAAMTTGALLIGIGMGVCNIVFLLVVQGSVGWSERGVATASTLFTRTIGQTIGAGLAGAILNFGISRRAPNINRCPRSAARSKSAREPRRAAHCAHGRGSGELAPRRLCSCRPVSNDHACYCASAASRLEPDEVVNWEFGGSCFA